MSSQELKQQIEKVEREVSIIKKVIFLAKQQAEKRAEGTEKKTMDHLLQQLDNLE